MCERVSDSVETGNERELKLKENIAAVLLTWIPPNKHPKWRSQIRPACMQN